MHARVSAVTVALLVACALAARAGTAAAQTLQPGTWTGTITPPGQQARAVTYEVALAHDSVSVIMHVPEVGALPFEDVRLQEGELRFGWDPGVPLTCALAPREAGGWAGQCAAADGVPGDLVMVPPKPEAGP